ncbi:MAG: 4Fe-4S binding protein, partial [Pseudomonadota bacterium]
LAPAIEGDKEYEATSKLFDIGIKDTFFASSHNLLEPVSTANEGIKISGCAQGPKDIPGAIEQGEAASGKILSKLIPGEKLQLNPLISIVDENICSGCKLCITLCPYKAITYTDKKKAEINEVLCTGCGVCVAACPSSAIKALHFTDRQISVEIDALLDEEKS